MTPFTFAMYVIAFAILLSFPVRHLIFNFSVRRLQIRVQRELSEEELAGQKRRAWVLATFISISFSFIFSLNIVGMPSYG
ncbi:hypothetical protein ACN2MM_10760 [Alkalilimnicola ehrlichii MLHE-1]|nr:hypothetical protein [Alkalilimnicola ehrlichii]